MIEKLRSMAIFATVVDQGTFRAAARHLGLAPSRISQMVSALEQELGVTLLYRSTRQLSLTNEGHILYGKVGEMLQAAETGLDAINQLSNQPNGELRITAPAFVTQTGLMKLFSEFSKAHPGIRLKFNFSDRSQDIIKEGYDLGIRAGLMQDSDLMSRSIGQVNRLLVASPEYVASMPKPSHPKDLEQWDWIQFSVRPERIELFSDNGDSVSIASKFRIDVDSVYALNEFAIHGMGLTRIPETLAMRGIQQGHLVHVMSDWSFAPLEYHTVWPDRSRRESLVLILVRFLANKSNRL